MDYTYCISCLLVLAVSLFAHLLSLTHTPGPPELTWIMFQIYCLAHGLFGKRTGESRTAVFMYKGPICPSPETCIFLSLWRLPVSVLLNDKILFSFLLHDLVQQHACQYMLENTGSLIVSVQIWSYVQSCLCNKLMDFFLSLISGRLLILHKSKFTSCTTFFFWARSVFLVWHPKLGRTKKTILYLVMTACLLSIFFPLSMANLEVCLQ